MVSLVPIATIYCLFLVSPVQGWAKWLHPCHCQFFGILFGEKNFMYPWEFSKKSPCLWASFHPYPLFEWGIQSKELFIKSGYEMLKLGSWCTSFESNYSGCTGRSSKNIRSISGGAQGKERESHNRMKLSFPQKNGAFLSFTPMLVYFFAGFFKNQGFGVFLTLRKTLIAEVVPAVGLSKAEVTDMVVICNIWNTSGLNQGHHKP